MDRRKFLKQASFSGVALSAAAMPVMASAKGEKHNWTMVTAFGKGGILGNHVQYIADWLKIASNGRINIDLYYAGEVVGAFESFNVVSSGEAQIGIGAPYYWANRSQAFQFVSTIPFGLTLDEAVTWVRHAGGQEVIDNLYKKHNAKFFAAGDTGFQMGGWFKKEMNTVDDFKGLKLRMPGLGGEILKEFGAAITNIPGTEVLQALSTGVVDAVEWVNPVADLGAGLHKAAKYYYAPGWQEPHSFVDLFINFDVWNSLDEELKQVIDMVSHLAIYTLAEEFMARNNEALQTLKKEGVEIRNFNDDILKALREKSEELLPTWAEKDPLGNDIYQSLISFRKTMEEYAKYTSLAFSHARSL